MKRDRFMDNGQNRILDEVAKFFTDVGGAAKNLSKEAETVVRAQSEKIINKLDLVKREDFEVLKEMFEELREENVALCRRVEQLEEKAGIKQKTSESQNATNSS